MNIKTLDIIENVTIGLGVAISLPQIETILGIIILAIQLILLTTKGCIAIYKKLKAKDLDGAIKTIDETKEELDKMTAKNKDDTNTQ